MIRGGPTRVESAAKSRNQQQRAAQRAICADTAIAQDVQPPLDATRAQQRIAAIYEAIEVQHPGYERIEDQQPHRTDAQRKEDRERQVQDHQRKPQ